MRDFIKPRSSGTHAGESYGRMGRNVREKCLECAGGAELGGIRKKETGDQPGGG